MFIFKKIFALPFFSFTCFVFVLHTLPLPHLDCENVPFNLRINYSYSNINTWPEGWEQIFFFSLVFKLKKNFIVYYSRSTTSIIVLARHCLFFYRSVWFLHKFLFLCSLICQVLPFCYCFCFDWESRNAPQRWCRDRGRREAERAIGEFH